MHQSPRTNDHESSALGWKFVIIVGVVTTIFFTFLYLAMTSEPDYMPSQKAKEKTSHQVVTAEQNVKHDQASSGSLAHNP